MLTQFINSYADYEFIYLIAPNNIIILFLQLKLLLNLQILTNVKMALTTAVPMQHAIMASETSLACVTLGLKAMASSVQVIALMFCMFGS